MHYCRESARFNSCLGEGYVSFRYRAGILLTRFCLRKVIRLGIAIIMKRFAVLLPLGAFLSACASTPQGPTIPVMPARGKPYAQFQQEAAFCQSQAGNAVRGQAEHANSSAALKALIPAAVGAGLGAAVGSTYWNPWHGNYAGQGAAIGAGSGAAIGGVMAASSSQRAQGGIQMQYDNAYAACMVSYGNLVPGMPQAAMQGVPQAGPTQITPQNRGPGWVPPTYNGAPVYPQQQPSYGGYPSPYGY